MKTKVCSKCKKKKNQKDFSLSKSKRDGFNSHCKSCRKAFYEANKDKILAKQRAYWETNKEKLVVRKKAYWEANKKKLAESKKAFYKANRKKILDRTKAYQEANKEKAAAYKKDWYQANKEKILKQRKAYYETNKEKIIERIGLYKKKRKKKDLVYNLRENCRSRISSAFRRKGFKKKSKTAEMLGCDWEFLKFYIESQFKNGMSWENRDKWHIDHIIPLASASSEDDVIKLSHFSNLQPLWAEENRKKADKIIECQPELTLKH